MSMKEQKENRIPLLPMLVALLILGAIFYFRSDNPASPESEEVAESNMGLPEDKIIEFVVDKVTDVIRLYPQRAHTTCDD